MTSTETPEKSTETEDAPYLLRRDNDGVTTLTFNRPKEMNALSEGMLAALTVPLPGTRDWGTRDCVWGTR